MTQPLIGNKRAETGGKMQKTQSKLRILPLVKLWNDPRIANHQPMQHSHYNLASHWSREITWPDTDIWLVESDKVTCILASNWSYITHCNLGLSWVCFSVIIVCGLFKPIYSFYNSSLGHRKHCNACRVLIQSWFVLNWIFRFLGGEKRI